MVSSPHGGQGGVAGTIAFVKISDKQRRYLKGLAHPLKPVILIGNSGLTEAVVAETVRALHDHELIKVRMSGAERTVREKQQGHAAYARVHFDAILRMLDREEPDYAR